jgi:hypothetical protein
MFGTFFKASLKALPFIVLVPLVTFTLYVLVIHGLIEEYLEVNKTWLDLGRFFIMRDMAIAIAANLFFLIFIPCALGGLSPAAKRVQFYIGFFGNLALSLLFPIVLCYWYTWVSNGISESGYMIRVDNATFAIIAALHVIMFIVAFIAGARFVAPAYAKAFWFTDRS